MNRAESAFGLCEFPWTVVARSSQPFSDRGRRENKSGDEPAVVPGRVCLMLDLLPESEESSCGK